MMDSNVDASRPAWHNTVGNKALWTGAALVIVMVLSAWVRLDGLGSNGFWRDEAQCIFIAQKSFPAGIVDALLAEAHPPLYYAMQHFWIELAGWTEFRIRSLSAVFGILLTPGLFVVGRRFFGPLAGLGAALIGALAPLHVAVSQTARMYSLLALLSLLSVWFLYEAWERGRWWWAGYILATVGVLYTHNWGLFLLAAQNGFALWMLIRREEWHRRLLPWVLGQFAIGLLYLPWFFNLLEQVKIIIVLPFVPVPTAAEKLWELAGDLLAVWPAMPLWLALLALGLWPRGRGAGAEESEGALALVVWCSLGTLGVGLLVSLGTYGQVPSYVTLSAIPALYLLLGRGLTRLRPAWIALPLAVLVVVFSFQGIERTRFMFTSSLREIARTVESEAGPHDMIVIAPDYLATTFNTYYEGTGPQIAFPWTMRRLEEINCVGWNDRWYRAAEAVPATLDAIDAGLAQGGQLWFIAAPDEFPNEQEYYGQIRRLKEELDARYTLRQTKNDFRNAAEWADVYVYSRP